MKKTAKNKLDKAIDKMLGFYPPGTKVRMLKEDYGMKAGTITTVAETPVWDKDDDVWIAPKDTPTWQHNRVCVLKSEIERV